MSALAPVITIDGPAGAGKGTLARLLAARFRFHYLDSGTLYRLLALAADRDNLPVQAEVLARLVPELDICFESIADVLPDLDTKGKEGAEGIEGVEDTEEAQRAVKVSLDNCDVTDAIRSEKIGQRASEIAVLPEVRAALLECQRTFRQPPGLVTDGRDMGTVVFPDARLKIFLFADLEERAHRRCKQLKISQPCIKMRDTIEDMRLRDEQDIGRWLSPLRPAEDALMLNSTNCSIGEVLSQAEQIALSVGLIR